MLFDDRLATVLRARADSEPGARTQFRQLLDLLGSGPMSEDLELVLKAYERLTELGEIIPGDEQSRIIRQPGLRLRNRHLVSFLARGEAKPAAAAMATAQLRARDWLMIIPRLPIVARGFLRHRRDLPQDVRHLLDRLGVQDMVLPRPVDHVAHIDPISDQADSRSDSPASAGRAGTEARPDPGAGEPVDTTMSCPSPSGSIASVLKRIAEFQETRRARVQNQQATPRDLAGELAADPLARFDLTSDATGTIVAASAPVSPWLVGLDLADRTVDTAGSLARLDPATRAAHGERRPFHGGRLELDAAPAVSGEWRIDGAPRFEPSTGRFLGYFLRLQRPQTEEGLEAGQGDSPADLMRQTLHELRTPVNAIQGFAEIIQHQLFGPVPNTYRALAAGIAVDAAKLLAGFDEIDRLTRLEAGALELDEGTSDLHAVLADTVKRLDGVLRERQAGFVLTVQGAPFTVAIAEGEAALIAWRLLAGLAGSLSPGERAEVRLSSDREIARLEIEMPWSLVEVATAGEDRPVVSAGMFSRAFTLRLAEAEVRAAGGSFTISREWLRVRLPLVKPKNESDDTTLASAVRAS